MNRITVWFVAGLAAVAGYLFGRAAGESPPPAAEPMAQSRLDADTAACPELKSANLATAPETMSSAPNDCAGAYQGMTPVDLLALPTDFEQTAALYLMAQQADLDTLKTHISNALSIALAGERAAALSILFSRFADIDPAAALAHYQELNLQGQAGILFPMFSGWAKTDLAAAIERATALTNPSDRRTADRAILQANASAPAEELEWISRELGHADQGGNQASHQALARRAQTEPEAAARTAMALQDPQARLQALAWVVNTWAESDADAAIAFVRGLDQPEMRARLAQIVIGQVAQRSPEKALQLAESQQGQQRELFVHSVIMTLAQTDPRRALQVAGTLRSQQHQYNAYQNLFSQWAHSDAEGAAAALETLSDLPADRKYPLAATVAQTMAASDPEAALAWARRWDEVENPGSYQTRIWDSVVQQIANNDPERALVLAAELASGARRTNLVSHALAQLASLDPLAALDQLDLVPSGEPRLSAMRQVISTWVQQNPVMAMDWVMALEPAQRQQALQSVAWNLITSDLELALAYTDDMTLAEKSLWISQLVGSYAERDPQQAVAWISQYQDLHQYGEWIGSIARVLVREDPRRALALLDRIEQPEQLRAAQLEVIAAWAQFDPIGAGKWWHKQPDGERHSAVLMNLVSSWASQDRDSARKWVLRLPSVEERDLALLSYLQAAGHDLADNEKWILEIQNGDHRFQAYQQQLWTLMNGDAGRVEQWLQNARLDPDQKAQLKQQIEDMRQHLIGTGPH